MVLVFHLAHLLKWIFTQNIVLAFLSPWKIAIFLLVFRWWWLLFGYQLYYRIELIELNQLIRYFTLAHRPLRIHSNNHIDTSMIDGTSSWCICLMIIVDVYCIYSDRIHRAESIDVTLNIGTTSIANRFMNILITPHDWWYFWLMYVFGDSCRCLLNIFGSNSRRSIDWYWF